MEFVEFNLDVIERSLTHQNYERVAPVAERLLGQGYTPVKVATLMFQYGYVFGRKLMKDSQKEKRRQRFEAYHNPKVDTKTERQTSGENEGSV